MSLSHRLGLLGRKVGMMRIFTDDGDAVPVTVLDVSNNRVTQVKTDSVDGYSAIQVAFGSRKASRVTKPEAGHLAKAGVLAGEVLREFRVTAEVAAEYKPGATLPVGLFAVGQTVDVQGTSIGKGFTGTIKRHNFKSQRASHGNSRSHNVPGSISMAQDPGRVFPGKKMSGHRGDETVTTQNLDVVRIDEARQLLLVRGAVPGAKNGHVVVAVHPRGQGERAKPREPSDAARAPQRTRPVHLQGGCAGHRVRARLQRSAGAPGGGGLSRPTRARARAPRRTAAPSSTRRRSRGARRAPAAPVRA